MKNQALFLITLIAASLLAPPAFSQDISHAELNTTPLSINPAFTGMFNGDARASAIYTNQWSAFSVPYHSVGGSMDLPVFIDHKNDYISAGLQSSRSSFGDGGPVTFHGLASVAFHKFFKPARDSNNSHCSDLAIGLQAGYNQATVTDQYFVDPWNSYVYPMWPGNTINYYSVNAGICYLHAAGKQFSYTVGLAAYNINKPQTAFPEWQTNNLGMERKLIGEIGASWNAANRLTLKPAIIFQNSGSNTDLIEGTEVSYAVGKFQQQDKPANSVFAGVWYRSIDELMITAGIAVKGLRLGVSYDYSLDYYSYSNDAGGMSAFIQYIVPAQKLFGKRRMIPCTRF